MKKFLKNIISKFKKFWNKKDNDTSVNYCKKECHLYNYKDGKKNKKLSSLPLEFMVSNIGGYNFEDIAVKTRKKTEQSVFIDNKFVFLIVIIHKRN